MEYQYIICAFHDFFQVSQMNATLAPVFMEVLLKNQPEGVQLAIKEVTTAG